VSILRFEIVVVGKVQGIGGRWFAFEESSGGRGWAGFASNCVIGRVVILIRCEGERCQGSVEGRCLAGLGSFAQPDPRGLGGGRCKDFNQWPESVLNAQMRDV
jgi:hypothetical protein